MGCPRDVTIKRWSRLSASQTAKWRQWAGLRVVHACDLVSDGAVGLAFDAASYSVLCRRIV